MTALTCRQCGERMERKGSGPAPTYCSAKCRVAASRGVSPRKQASPPADDRMPSPVTSSAHRPNLGHDLGDGDPCPQDPAHGRMYFFGEPSDPAARQWCPSSWHEGSPWFARDGVTPAPRRARDIPATETAARGGPARELTGASANPATPPVDLGALGVHPRPRADVDGVPKPPASSSEPELHPAIAVEPGIPGRGAIQLRLPETVAI